MRLFIFIKAQLLTIRGIGTQFINHNIFLRLAFDTLQIGQSKGGLGILDPVKQQNALQWRWVRPLLVSDQSPVTPSRSLTSLSVLRYTLHWYYSSPQFPSYLFPLIFSCCRSPPWKSTTDFNGNLHFLIIFNNFFRTIDMLPRSFDRCHVNASTCLSFPFLDIITHSLPESHPAFITFTIPQQLLQNYPGVKKLLTSDVFLFDLDRQVLRVRCLETEIICFRNISRFVINLILQRKIFFQLFFAAQCLLSPNIPPEPLTFRNLELSPISSALRTNPKPTTKWAVTSIKYYKGLISPPSQSPLIINSRKWLEFWHLKIPLPARTIWYRAIHNKILTKSILHRFFPDKTESPNCLLCLSTSISEETVDHFLFACPSKNPIWFNIITSYISSTGIPSFHFIVIPTKSFRKGFHCNFTS
ncbi:hypothetical protein EDC94DRAFT_117898 [Helicostylum pulchrum]|nr:hypothetical protein EDC94DRAFT_117898 [Helicostylum pulchrum]